MSDARIGPAEAHEKMKNESFTYVDVRTEEEFAAGHPEGAFNVPISHAGAAGMEPNADFLAVMEKTFAKDAPLVVGCKAGGRSAKAQQVLTAAGFTRVIDQEGGWDGKKGAFGEQVAPGWSKSSLPTGTGQPPARAYATLKT
jgi:rhodanese-related sulfurtransferase